ncbi:hypothetical protein [Vibrio phage vB_pir03]|nr:hypothetical protein [Vibrio phage vB_pir03]
MHHRFTGTEQCKKGLNEIHQHLGEQLMVH